MRPVQLLMNEHRVIEVVLTCLDRLADQCEAGQPLDQASASDALQFFRDYADHCHHGKEEDLLFPVMEAKGFSREQGPTGVMVYEHDLGRKCVRAMAEAVRTNSAATFAEHARVFSSLLRSHIQKEDHCLFAMADQALTRDDQSQLWQSFERFENDPQEAAQREACLAIALRLAQHFGLATQAIEAAAAASV